MLEVVRLDERHGADLYKFFVKHKDVGGLQLIHRRDVFLTPPRGAAVACLENKELKQVLLCEIKDDTCFTRGIMGDFGMYTLDVFDILCAICSSSTPLITKHRMVIQPNHIDSFKALWPKTRLGKMSIIESWTGIVFRATINYP